MYCVFVSVLLCFSDKKKNFFVPLFRERLLTRRPYGHFAAFLCFRKLFFHIYWCIFCFEAQNK